MLKSETHRLQYVPRRHASSVVVVTGKPSELDAYEAARNLGKVSGAVQSSASALPAPAIYAYSDKEKEWKLATEASLQDFLETVNTAEDRLQTRRYRLSTGQDPTALELELCRMFRQHPDQYSSLSAHVDHVFQASVGGYGGGGPTLREAPRTTETKEDFAKQACFSASRLGIGAKDKREDGEGVTVAILDTSPQREYVCPDLINFWLDLSTGNVSVPEEDKDVLATPAGMQLPSEVDIKAAEANRKDKDFKAGTLLDRNDLWPYHGLMIASLIRHVAPKATIVLIKVLDDDGEAAGSTITHALDILHALQQKQTTANGRRVVEDKLVVNLSFGLFRTQAEEIDAPYMLNACAQICRSAGAGSPGNDKVLIVASSGNNSFDKHPQNPQEPSAYGYFADDPATDTNLITVAATSITDKNGKDTGKIGAYAWFSNQANFGAPGHDLVMDLGSKYETRVSTTQHVVWSGTSFAAPLVAGVAASLMSKSNGNLSANAVKKHLWQTAEKPSDWNGVPEIRLSSNSKKKK